MSLISSANFIAPLRNKFQIVGIFVLAVLFCIIRMAGSGEVTSEDDMRGGAEARDSSKGSRGGDPEIDSYFSLRKGSRGATEGAGDEAVDSLMKGTDPETRRRIAEASRNEDEEMQPEKLNDIKDMLDRGFSQ